MIVSESVVKELFYNRGELRTGGCEIRMHGERKELEVEDKKKR